MEVKLILNIICLFAGPPQQNYGQYGQQGGYGPQGAPQQGAPNSYGNQGGPPPNQQYGQQNYGNQGPPGGQGMNTSNRNICQGFSIIFLDRS